MRYITYLTLFLFSCSEVGCSNFGCSSTTLQNKDRIIGIWLLSDFTINGYDKTKDINHEHQQWLQLKEDGTFLSGSYKIENSGTWKLTRDEIIEIKGQNKDWCNSTWRLQVNTKNLLLKGQAEVGTSTLAIILDRTDKLPIYKQYFSKPVDRLVGLWEAVSDVNTKDTGFWIRMKSHGEFSVGDSTGELFSGKFLYTHQDSSLVLEKKNRELANCKIHFEDNHHMILRKSLADNPIKLKRIATFAVE